jgi:HAD superfamily hydrolase (TIGR01549 family)
MKHKKHYIFDFDDTLADSGQFNQDMFVEVFKDYADITEPETEQYLRKLHFDSRGTAMFDQFKKAKEDLSLQVTVEVLLEENERIQVEQIASVTLFDSARELLKQLQKGNKQVSLMSNRQKSSLMKVLHAHELVNCFDNVISCADDGYEKPDPHCLNKLIAETKIERYDVIYFGDSSTDAKFAAAAGVDFVIIDQYANQKAFFKHLLPFFELSV